MARDRLGIKPLYYARSDDLLVFASELKSLLASGLVEPDLDYEAIDAYLTFGVRPRPAHTPGAGLEADAGTSSSSSRTRGVRTERYWRYPEPQVTARLSAEEYQRLLLEKLDESVRLRLMSDVPLGRDAQRRARLERRSSP